MKIGFIVDHPKRDLPSGVMIAHALAKRGVETVLVPLYEQAVDVPLLRLDALIINYARPANLDLVRGYHSMGLPVWVLDTEGGVLADDGANSPDRMAAYVRDSGYLPLLAGYFFWGPILHEAFRSSSELCSNRLHVTGCPRFDYAAPRWRDVLTFDRENYVLINANFPLVNSLFSRSPEGEKKALISAGWQSQYIDQIIADSHHILANFIDTVRQLSIRLPQQSFLVRPHPFENSERYRHEFLGQANIRVDGSGSVLNAIHNSVCIIHLNCGTSIEAVLLEKTPLSMEFLNTPQMATHSSLPSRVSKPVSSLDDLVQEVKKLVDGAGDFDFSNRHAKIIEPWFHMNDGGAAERIADVLMSHLHNSSKKSLLSSIRASLGSSRERSSWKQRLQATAANAFGSRLSSRVRSVFQPVRSEKHLDLNVVSSSLDALARHEGVPTLCVASARHPLTGSRLASVSIKPFAASRLQCANFLTSLKCFTNAT
jgi:surface carbohydrate biosynthesis protein